MVQKAKKVESELRNALANSKVTSIGDIHRNLKQIQNIRYKSMNRVDDMAIQLLDQLVNPNCFVSSILFGDHDLIVTFGYSYQIQHFNEVCCTEICYPATFDTTFNLGKINILIFMILGDFYLSFFTYKEYRLNEEPVFLGPGFLHQKKRFFNLCNWFTAIRKS